jgi:acyl-CoA thioester hydrolase
MDSGAASSVARPRAVTVAARHVEPFRIRFDEAGGDGALRTSAYLRWMQDAASVHSSAAGYTREWYRDHGLFWLVRHLDLRVHLPSHPGEVLDVSTEVVGFRRIWARRRSEFRAARGRLAAEADIDWVLTTAAGRPTRVPDEIVERFPALETEYAPARLDMPEIPDDAASETRRAEPHELDPMGHVNNAAYVDQFESALDAVDAAVLRSAVPRHVLLEYLAPAPPGALITWRIWRIAEGSAGVADADPDKPIVRIVVRTG